MTTTVEVSVRKFYEGDGSAVAEIVKVYGGVLRRKLYLLRKDRSLEQDDLLSVMAEGVVVALSKFGRFAGKATLRAVYAGIRTALLMTERGAREATALEFDPAVFVDYDDFLLHLDLARAIQRLSGKVRLVAELWRDGATTEESAVVLGLGKRYVHLLREKAVRSIRNEFLQDALSAT